MRQFASDTGMAGAVYQFDGVKDARTHCLKYGGIRIIGSLSQVPAHRHRHERGDSPVFRLGTGTHTSSGADVDCGTDCVGRCTQ
jgi:hypothetical protein